MVVKKSGFFPSGTTHGVVQMAGKKAGGGTKQTTQSVSSIASKGLRTGNLTKAEIRKVSASALGQDEHKGPRKKK